LFLVSSVEIAQPEWLDDLSQNFRQRVAGDNFFPWIKNRKRPLAGCWSKKITVHKEAVKHG